jgi:putative transposase
MLYVRFPLSLRNVEEILIERGIDICYETVRFWWNRFGPIFASEIRKKRTNHPVQHSNWRWHLDEVFVKLGGEFRYMWRAVDHEGEVLDAIITKKRDKKAALKVLKKLMKRYGRPKVIVTDRLKSYSAALKDLNCNVDHEVGRWMNNRAENSHLVFRRRERAMCRFRSDKTLQKFTVIHGQVHNHFNGDRHLATRQHYRENRSAALAEWQCLAA